MKKKIALTTGLIMLALSLFAVDGQRDQKGQRDCKPEIVEITGIIEVKEDSMPILKVEEKTLLLVLPWQRVATEFKSGDKVTVKGFYTRRTWAGEIYSFKVTSISNGSKEFVFVNEGNHKMGKGRGQQGCQSNQNSKMNNGCPMNKECLMKQGSGSKKGK
ncbi:MAG: hypothetical protein JXR63_05230 [Spirochaetales bacterium]|nr:hypothetical protein [Spirochaetales bacterium]